MRKSLVYALLILFAVVIGSGSASAQVFINLGLSLQNVTITRSGSNYNVALGTCTSCTLSSSSSFNRLSVNGVASANSGTYTFTTMLNMMSTLPSLTNAGMGVYDYHDNGSMTTFSISGIDGNMANSLMLTLTFTQVTGGNTNDITFHGHYVVTSDTDSVLSMYFITNSVGEFNFTVHTDTPLDSLADAHSTSGQLVNGAIHTPEPASIALFGSGLLLLGRMLRRRKTSSPAEPSTE